MPWKEVKPMEQKLLFIADHLRRVANFSTLCKSYGISRRTGYKWLNRYRQLGLEGLQNQSRSPKTNPLKTPYCIKEAIIKIRRECKDPPGAKKIKVLLEQEHPEWDIPSKTTIHKILQDSALVAPSKPRRRVPIHPQPFAPVDQPNQVWSADFKGQFKTADGKWCYPLTIMDHHSRYLLACRTLSATTTDDTMAIFYELFQRYGLPERIRTDNGAPFASSGLAGLSHLSKWWIRLGIAPERIMPGKPQQNGRHERMHSTLKKAAITPAADNAQQQQKAFDHFIDTYNHKRPHESLGQRPPATVYTASSKNMPEQLPELDYPAHFNICLVNHNGVIYHLKHRVYIACLLKGEKVGLEQTSDTQWNVYFANIKLGHFDMSEITTDRNGYISLNV